jgi:hypothetical protein
LCDGGGEKCCQPPGALRPDCCCAGGVTAFGAELLRPGGCAAGVCAFPDCEERCGGANPREPVAVVPVPEARFWLFDAVNVGLFAFGEKKRCELDGALRMEEAPGALSVARKLSRDGATGILPVIMLACLNVAPSIFC